MLQPLPATPRKKKRGMWIAILAVVLTVAALAVVWVVKHRAPPITVQTTKVSRHSITNLVVANGQIQPVVQVTISPEVSGEITELPVKEGQLVKQGRFAGENQAGCLCRGGQSIQGQLRIVGGRPGPVRGQRGEGRRGLRAQSGIVQPQTAFGIGLCRVQGRARTWPAPSWKAPPTR